MGGSSSKKEPERSQPKPSASQPSAGYQKSNPPQANTTIPQPRCQIPKKAKGSFDVPDYISVGEPIGTGAYGSVVQATDTRTNKVLAIKRVESLFEELTDCKRILREFALLSRLDNPHIIKLYDFIIPGDLSSFNEIYIMMEMCDSDMKKLVKTDVNLEQLHISTLLYNLLVGLKYLHSAGVIHRDLKPANVLCNQDCSVKICDFGLSRTVPLEEGHINHTEDEGHPEDPTTETPNPVVAHTARQKRQMTKHVVTRWYRAPEVILKEPKQTGQLDVWSVACIYAELLQMLEGNRYHDRGPLFPGRSCYPLSPDHARYSRGVPGQHRTKYDQLVIILMTMGTPTAADVALLAPGEGRRWLSSLEAQTGDGLQKRLPRIEGQNLDIMNGMLRFSPQNRMTVDQCLDHPILKDVREPDQELVAKKKAFLQFDTDQPLGERDLRHWFGEEKKALDQQGRTTQ